MIKTDIVVLGGGVVGLATTLRLLNSGREVILIDPEEPGTGASYGNAGTIAEYAVLPVGSPDIFKKIPSLLLNKKSSISIKRSEILSLAPWLLRFLYQSMPKQATINAKAITGLLFDSRKRWELLVNQIDADSILKSNGTLYFYQTKSSYEIGKKDMAKRKTLGLNVEMLSPIELGKLEPNLKNIGGGASFFPDGAYMSDPGKIMKLLLDAIIKKGCQFIKKGATSIERCSEGVEVVLADNSKIIAKHLVISAGAYSKKFANQIGDYVPLDVERGYHVEYDMEKPLLNRPCCSAEKGFYMSPMTGRLRVVGTVELGGLSTTISQHRVDYLERSASSIFPDLGLPNRTWLGFRPSIPDSLPVISESSKGNDIIYAFGHGHIGLTLAPITAEIVESIITKTKPPLAISAYSVKRF
jgi:D-hydroxyproline dehydrogenase